jgi:hypothetical protein
MEELENIIGVEDIRETLIKELFTIRYDMEWKYIVIRIEPTSLRLNEYRSVYEHYKAVEKLACYKLKLIDENKRLELIKKAYNKAHKEFYGKHPEYDYD